jgi:CheY-like chemotaxis protein
MLPKPEPQEGVVHVLVVEDEVLLRALIAEELRSAGCAVIEARHAGDALAYIQAGGQVDLVFSDIQMPGPLDGRQLAERIHRDYPAIPVILTSGNRGLEGTVTTAPFVSKPYDVRRTVALMFAILGLPLPGDEP